MKRSGPLRRSGALTRGSRLAPRSQRRIDEAPERRALVARLIEERRACEAKALFAAALVGSFVIDESRRKVYEAWRACRYHEPVDGHELRKRSRGGDYLDPDGILVLCRPCHDFTEREVAISTAVGLLLPSWSPDTPPR